MNILLLTAHSIAEFDDLRMLTEMGHQVYSIGAYSTPMTPSDDKRPPLPQVPTFPHFNEFCERQRRDNEAKHGSPGPRIDWAKADIADEILQWAETVIVHHFPEQWIAGNWEKFARHGNRVIWRTCGQSNPSLEAFMAPGREDGMQIVRYSPKERHLPNYAGEDAVIRFGKEPDEWCGWHGDGFVRDRPFIGNVTQDLKGRGAACGYAFWQAATAGLHARPAGPKSEALEGGVGALTYEGMQEYLRQARVYLYTGTQPASYTLGLIEAMMTGVPVVSIGPVAFGPGWVGEVFEGHEIAGPARGGDPNSPDSVRRGLRIYLGDRELAREDGEWARQRAIDLFGMDKIKAEWAAFLG